jgi:hypothetical protein
MIPRRGRDDEFFLIHLDAQGPNLVQCAQSSLSPIADPRRLSIIPTDPAADPRHNNYPPA